jgi:hypothetical protein
MELSNLKNALAFIAFIGVFVIAFTIATCSREAVPDRAQFLVNTNDAMSYRVQLSDGSSFIHWQTIQLTMMYSHGSKTPSPGTS